MDPHGPDGADRREEHVAPAEELFGPGVVEDGPAVDLGRHRECDARRDVGFDQAGDDVDRGPLRGDDQVDPHGAGHLGQPADDFFEVRRRDHHQIRQFVDDDDDVGERAVRVLRVERLDVPNAVGGEQRVAGFHLLDRPAELGPGLPRAGHHGAEQVRDAVVVRQFDPLGIDHQKPHLLGGGAEEDGRDHRVERHALAGSGGSRDQEVRHRHQISDHRLAGDALAHRDRER